MNKPEAILFDMGDTLLSYDDFQAQRGTKKMMEHLDNPHNIPVSRVQEMADEMITVFDDIKQDKNIEISVQSLYRLLIELHGMELEKPLVQLELIFKFAAWNLELKEGITELLNYLEETGIRTAVLSNSGFSGVALERELAHFGIRDSFEFVISTAEYCLRKPDRRIFEVALAKFNLASDEVWYVGNSFYHDVRGAYNAGLQPIWYNEDLRSPEAGIPHFAAEDHFAILEKLKKLS